MSSITILGDTSGSVLLQAPAVAGSSTVTLPTTGGTIRTTTTPGSVLQVVSSVGDSVTVTTAYNNAGLSPLLTRSITAVSSNSKFLITYSAVCGQVGPYRSQLLLSKNWVSGTAAIDGNYIWYDHYGMYIDSGITSRHPGGFTYLDTGTLTAGTSRTYYVFGGTIGGGTQTFTTQNLTVMEIAA